MINKIRVWHRYYSMWFWRVFYEDCEMKWMGEKWSDRYFNFIDWIASFAICLCIFHEAINDQCGKPEHRYCWMCGAPTPNWTTVD